MARRSIEADRLEALLSGEAPPDEAPRQLARLATLATTVREQTELEAPSEAFRARLRAELLTEATASTPTLVDRARDRVDTATARWRHSLRVAGATAVASMMIGTAGVAAASQSALPGDVLYAFKGFTENARLAFASADVERGRLHLAFARERLEEVEQGRAVLAPDQLIATLDRLDTEAAAGADELLAAAATGPDGPALLDELDAFTAELRARLLDVTPDLPLSVHPAAERSLEVLRRIDLQLTGLLASSSCDACGPAGWVPRVVLPGDGPAAPSCDCVGNLLTPLSSTGGSSDGDADRGDVDDDLGPVAPLDPNDADDVPRDNGDGLLGDVGDTVDDTASNLDDTVDDLGTNIDDAVDDVGTNVDDTVSDLQTDVDTTVDDTASNLDANVGDLGTTVDDPVSDVTTTAEDLGTLVDDVLGTSSDGGSPLD